jgi:Holliday junction resolvasome RuvABC endonuclease subunit
MSKVNIVALDLGTMCGWAVYNHITRTITHGSTDLSVRSREHQGARWLRFRRLLSDVFDMAKFDHTVVYYEQVVRHGAQNSTYAAHVYGAFEGQLELFCLMRGEMKMIGLKPAEIKKSFTGKGNVNKLAMLAEAQRRGYAPKDDNAADAIAIAHCALEKLKIEPIITKRVEAAIDAPF